MKSSTVLIESDGRKRLDFNVLSTAQDYLRTKACRQPAS